MRRVDRLDVRQPVHPLQEGEQPVTAGIGIGPLEARMQIRHGDTPGLTRSRPGRGGRPGASIPDFWVEGARRGYGRSVVVAEPLRANVSAATSSGSSTGTSACRISPGPSPGILGRAVPFDGVCLLTVDRATLLPTGEVVEGGLPAAAMIRLTEIELREPDFNKFIRPRPRGSADGQPQRRHSGRPRPEPAPARGAGGRAASPTSCGPCCRVPPATWGARTLLREARRPHFTPAEVRFVASLAGSLADGLRRAALLRRRGSTGRRCDDTGLLVLAADDTVEMANPAAGRWLTKAGTRPGGIPRSRPRRRRRARAAAAGGRRAGRARPGPGPHPGLGAGWWCGVRFSATVPDPGSRSCWRRPARPSWLR